MALKKHTSDNIMVCVRVRPFNGREVENNYSRCIDMPTTRHVVIYDDVNIQKQFAFDRAYWSFDKENPGNDFCTQQTLYDELGQNLIENAMIGYNNCLFAYGQTGSGKSYSVLGELHSEEYRGILPRVVEGLFDRFKEVTREGGKVKCEVSFLEIYNEKLKDLLLVVQPGKEAKPLDVKTTQEEGSHVPGLTRTEVFSAAEALNIVGEGVARREVGATDMNATSSRSHCIFTFRMQMEIVKMGIKKTFKSQTHLVDLAGSERAEKTGAVGKRFAEGVAINSSLSVLARVISALAAQADGKKGAQNPPFRESKLTALLKDSLTGNSRTVMMAALSPALDSYEETLGTLLFAKNVKSIKTNAVGNVKAAGAGGSAHLQAQIENLSNLLAGLGVDVDESTPENIVMKEEEDGSGGLQLALPGRQNKQITKLMEQLEEQQLRVQEYYERYGEPTTALQGIIQSSDRQLQYTPHKDTQMQPYLMNVSDDPLKSGALMYFLKKDTTAVVGSHQDVDIRFEEGNIWPFHCALKNINDVDIQLSTSTPDDWEGNGGSTKARRIIIEKPGRAKMIVPSDSSVDVSHNDIVQFSARHRFRLILPFCARRARIDRARTTRGKRQKGHESPAQTADEDSVCSEVDSEDFGESEMQHTPLKSNMDHLGANVMAKVSQMVEHNSPSYTSALTYVRDLSTNVPENRCRAFLVQLSRVYPLLWEANTITERIVPRRGIYFEVGVITNILKYCQEEPGIVVRMFRARKTGAALWRHIVREKVFKRTLFTAVKSIFGDTRHRMNEIIAEFNLWEFRQRLHLMRRVMDMAMEEGLTKTHQFMARNMLGNDPWFYCDVEKAMKLGTEICHMMQLYGRKAQEHQNDHKRESLELELAQEAEKRFELQIQLRKEKELWIERLKTGDALLRKQHEQLVQEAINETMQATLKHYMSLEEHDLKMSEVQAKCQELAKRSAKIKETMMLDYVSRVEHERTVDNMQRQIKGWSVRALEAVNKELQAETRYRKALMDDDGLRSVDSSEFESVAYRRGDRLRLRLDGVDEVSCQLFTRIQGDVNDIMESLETVQGRLGKVTGVLHA